VEDRRCINCGKIIPNFRSERAKTCSIQCSHDWNHSSVKRREEKLKKWNVKVVEKGQEISS